MYSEYLNNVIDNEMEKRNITRELEGVKCETAKNYRELVRNKMLGLENEIINKVLNTNDGVSKDVLKVYYEARENGCEQFVFNAISDDINKFFDTIEKAEFEDFDYIGEDAERVITEAKKYGWVALSEKVESENGVVNGYLFYKM